jgi:hypothetical protein
LLILLGANTPRVPSAKATTLKYVIDSPVPRGRGGAVKRDDDKDVDKDDDDVDDDDDDIP